MDAVDDERTREGKGEEEKGRKEIHNGVDDSDDKVMMMMMVTIRDESNGGCCG